MSRFDFHDTLYKMAENSQWMLKTSLDSFVEMNSALARKVCNTDDNGDSGLKTMYGLIQKEVRKDPGRIERLTQVLSVACYLERMADLSTNISEDVIYLSKGQIIRHKPEF
tara:strand:+ start:989 stop:1321 length:333 start_codon:yes stop_codon:yes gene_type:complete